MNVWESVLLGAIQGLTEFLPISSSAHLALAHRLFGWGVPGSGKLELSYDVALHAGTLLALAIYFARDWIQLITERDKHRLAMLILLACIPAGIAGVLLEKKAETVFRDPLRIAAMLAAMAVVMYICDVYGKKERKLEDLDPTDSVAIGVFQALALMPGVSRSGITIAAGLARGYTREAAARFSFLISLPITAGATLWKARHFHEILDARIGIDVIAGIISAAAFGYLAIDRLLAYLRSKDLKPFIIYRIILAAVVVAIVFARRS